jgi:putative oxidoreductase
MDQGLLVLRLVIGLVMAAHGAQKAFGWFGGYGIAGTGGYLEQLGFRPGRPFAAAAAGAELVGGLLIALGLGGPIGPALVLSVMVVAAVAVHAKGGLFVTTNGVEVPLLYGVAAAALGLTGFGSDSLDAALGISGVWTPAASWAALGAGIAGGVANLMLRRPAPVAEPAG